MMGLTKQFVIPGGVLWRDLPHDIIHMMMKKHGAELFGRMI
jgi:hypothetical protein